MAAMVDTATPQHLRALANANRIRLARAELKRKVASGELTVQEVVQDVPEDALTMTIADLLMAQHRWGRTRMRRFVAAVPLMENKQLGKLSPRQCDVVCARLNGEAYVDPFRDAPDWPGRIAAAL